MKLVPYTHDLNQIHEVVYLLDTYNQPIGYTLTLPKNGLLAYEDGKIVACGFIRCIEGGIGLLEGYAANKNIDKNVRDRALDLITTKLIKWAAIAKLKGLITFSLLPVVLDRAKKHGFKDTRMALLGLGLQ